MRIAMLSYHTCPLATLGGKDTGGMNVYVRDLTTYLGRVGVHADVFTRSQDDHVPHVLHDLGYGNRIVHIPSGPQCPIKKTELISHLDEFVDGIIDFGHAKNLTYDLIHSHYWLSGLAALKLRESFNAPILHMFHTLALMKNRVAQSDNELESPQRIASEQKIIKNVDGIIAATPAELSQLTFLYQADARKINIIPPGVDDSHFYPIPDDEAKDYIGIPQEDRMILYVGRIEPLKGIDTLIQAIAQLHRNKKDLEKCAHYLAIIGGDPSAEDENLDAEMIRLKKLTRDLGIENLVLFLGKRGQETLPYYYSAAEFVVMPSHYESFGMVALEAMACGTPVIASEVGGLAYLVQDGVNGYTIPSNDPEILGERINTLLCQNELLARMGEQAHQFASNHSWEYATRQIIDCYDRMINYPKADARSADIKSHNH